MNKKKGRNHTKTFLQLHIETDLVNSVDDIKNVMISQNEPCHKKTYFLHKQKQRHRSAAC